MSNWNTFIDTQVNSPTIIEIPLHTSSNEEGFLMFSAKEYTDKAGIQDNILQGKKDFIIAPHPAITSHSIWICPNGLHLFNGASLFIKEFPFGLTIMTPFIVIEKDASFHAGKEDARYSTELDIILTGKDKNGIDDPQLYSLFSMHNNQESWLDSEFEPGYTPKDQGEMQLYGNKVLAVGMGGRLELHGQKGATSWKKLNANIDADSDEIEEKNKVILEGDLSQDWKVGDRIVVTTSDFEPDHSEDATIKEINFDAGSRNTIITVEDVLPCLSQENPGNGAPSFQWSHWGTKLSKQKTTQDGTQENLEIDICASVGLLTRNIVISSARDLTASAQALGPKPTDGKTVLETESYQGVTLGLGGDTPFWKGGKYPGKFGDSLSNTCNRTDIYGGQTMFRRGSLIHISRVEFSYLGQPGNFARIGRYPVHFHMKFNDNLMLEDGERGDFLENCSIHHSFNRWVTIHGTHGVEVKGNVGYKSYGHGFYIEDGVEQLNILDGNLGICARCTLPHSSLGAAPITTYWNPLNIYPLTIQDRDTPSVFWIGNKFNVIRNNVAAGAAMGGRGFWLVGTKSTLRNGPSVAMAKHMGEVFAKKKADMLIEKLLPSINLLSNNENLSDAVISFVLKNFKRFSDNLRNIPETPYLEGVHAPLLEFDNNTAHSCWRGIGTASSDGGGILRENAEITDPNDASKTISIPKYDYESRLYAYDGDNEKATWMGNPEPKKKIENKGENKEEKPVIDIPVIDIMSRTNCFRNRQYGAWLRPFWWWVTRSTFVDNGFGLSLVSGGNDESFPAGYWGLVSESTFVGFSDNLYRNQSRAKFLTKKEANGKTDFDPTSDAEEQRVSGNIFGSGGGESPGSNGSYAHERRGYQFYDGPGPILADCNFYAFYPTFNRGSNLVYVKDGNITVNLQNTYPLSPRDGFDSISWAEWMTQLEESSTKALDEVQRREMVFHNAAIGWFGPGNTWKYSALTWTHKLFFDEDVIIRHLVYDRNTYAGRFGDGDLQTFILDKDGSLQGFTSLKGDETFMSGSSCVNNWSIHRFQEDPSNNTPNDFWQHECRSANSCIASPFYYANTDIIVSNKDRETKAILMGKSTTDFSEKLNLYYIPGQQVNPGDEGLSIYGTLNMTGARYTLQFIEKKSVDLNKKESVDPNVFELLGVDNKNYSSLNTTGNNQNLIPLEELDPKLVSPPKQFAIYCTSLNEKVGQNKILYAIRYPEGLTLSDFEIKIATLEISKSVGHSYQNALKKVNSSDSTILDMQRENSLTLKDNDGNDLAHFHVTYEDNLLLISVSQLMPRSNAIHPAGITNWNPKFPKQWKWTNMAKLQEGQKYDMQTVLDQYANSLNLTPEAGSPIISVVCTDTKFDEKKMPGNGRIITEVPFDVYDDDIKDIKLSQIEGKACDLHS